MNKIAAMSTRALRDNLSIATFALALIILASIFGLHQDHVAYSQYCELPSHAGEQACKLDREPFLEKLLSDPTALFTAVLAGLTFVLALTGSVQIVFLVRADATARMSAEAALKSANFLVAQEAPRLYIKNISIRDGKAKIILANAGKTTAVITSAGFGGGMFENLPEKPDGLVRTSEGVDLPNGASHTFTAGGFFTPSLGESTRLQKGEIAFYVYGSIRYQTDLNEMLEVGFCWTSDDLGARLITKENYTYKIHIG